MYPVGIWALVPSVTGDGGLIESEEDSAEEGGGLLIGIGLEVRVDIDDKRRADGREQTRLREQVRWFIDAGDGRRTNIKVVLRSSSYFLT